MNGSNTHAGRYLPAYLKENRIWILVSVLGIAGMSIVLLLAGASWREVLYGVLLWLFFALLTGCIDFFRFRAKNEALETMRQTVTVSLDGMPQPTGRTEENYQDLLAVLDACNRANSSEAQKKQTEMDEYYTMWVHQIKTPIAALRLLLQSGAPTNAGELTGELFRIEQYVEMALQYQRLDADSTDYRIEWCPLDGIVRDAVHKYASMFVRKKLTLQYSGISCRVLTDEKWLSFVIEQLLSNSIKYTDKGGVSIKMDMEKGELILSDTGIGIRPEDLPRVGEKGFTGYNGHSDKRSTGVGMYMVRRILAKLGHTFAIDSAPGKGTTVRIGFPNLTR